MSGYAIYLWHCTREGNYSLYSSSVLEYNASVANLSRVTIDSDGIFGDNTAAQMAAMTAALSGSVADGYTGTLTIGVPA